MSETTHKESFRNSTLVLLGVNHHTAPLEIRERLAIPAGRLAEATRSLRSVPGVRESLILSTCNRVELLTVQDAGPNHSSPDLLRFLNEFFSVSPATLRPHLYEYREREAVRHLFRVAASLDSMVVGEPQILGQVKESYTVAREVGAVEGGGAGGQLDRLLQSAFTVAKKVRTETEIGSSSVSIASVAVDLARKIFGSLAGKRVLLVGAGKMSELALRHLIQHGATEILLSNRTPERAEKIAAQFAGQFAERGVTTGLIAFDRLSEEAHRADIVLTSTGAQGAVFAREQGRQFIARRKGRPMFFIDIAVPRDVDPGMNKVEGCFVYDMDDLQQVAQANLNDRSREAAQAESIVMAEVGRFLDRLRSLDAVPAIRALQANAESVRLAELDRAGKALGSLTPEQAAAVEALTRSLTAKLLHPQLVALRQSGE